MAEHNHGHSHGHGGMKGRIILIAVTAALLIAAVLIEKCCTLATWQLLLVYLVPYLLIGRDTLAYIRDLLARDFPETEFVTVPLLG